MVAELDADSLTPLMRQYVQIKSQFPDTLVFFQVGDFYELFFKDAQVASSFLSIALTKRGTYKNEPIPLCGVPLHAVQHYLTKLVKGGFKVALCDQLEEPKPGALVRRGITQVLTPGTLVDANMLDDKSSSYLLSFFPLEHSWGLLFGELLSARLFGTIVKEAQIKTLEAELMRFIPDEIVLPRSAHEFNSFFTARGFFTSFIDTQTESQEIDEWISHFNPEVQLQLASNDALRMALSDFYFYVAGNQQAALEQFKSLQIYKPDDFLVLDSATVRNLEIVKNAHDGGRDHTLFQVVDGAVTSMGSRTIKKWLMCPLVDRQAIEQRYDAIAVLSEHVQVMQQLPELLNGIGDLERLVGRIALGRAVIADYQVLLKNLLIIPKIRLLLQSLEGSSLIFMIGDHLRDFEALVTLLKNALNDDNSQNLIIKRGFDERLDQMRELIAQAHQRILDLELQEQQKTGIGSLKIRYNQVFGYSIEITKSHLDEVPDYFVRQQTLVGKERFSIPALTQLEHDLRYAESAISQLETEIFTRIKNEVAHSLHPLRTAAYALSRLDALYGFARIAYEYGYVRPVLDDGHDICIEDGRHPVVERSISERFIPNTVQLTDTQSLWIITGPNMGGKSTFLRQVALICILAQAGSFVPARSARLPILDRIFTRIGAGDKLADGKSTFLVEMEETALICTQATQHSLVILDEVGRGTSTFDGLAVAQSVVEYLFNTVRARCLFATHYHELTLLKERFAGIENYHASCTKTKSGIVFLYKVIPGVADGSFGVEVARLAQVPDAIIKRAEQILTLLDAAEHSIALGGQHNSHNQYAAAVSTQSEKQLQATIKQLEQELFQAQTQLQQLRDVDLDELSPKKAFDLIWAIKAQKYESKK